MSAPNSLNNSRTKTEEPKENSRFKDLASAAYKKTGKAANAAYKKTGEAASAPYNYITKPRNNERVLLPKIANKIKDRFVKPTTNFINEYIKVEGKYIPENIEQEVLSGRKTNLIDKYRRKKDIAEKQAIETKQAYDERQKNLEIEEERNLQREIFHDKKTSENIKNAAVGFNWLFKILKSGIYELYKFIKEAFFGVSKGFSEFIITLSKSNSPVIKLICLAIIILAVIGLLFAAFGYASPNKFDFKNSTSMDIFTETKLPTMSSYISSGFTNIMPEKYRISFNSMYNNFQKAMGNDVIGNSIDNQLRETTNDGSWDDIYHLKKNNEDKRVYSIIKPKDIPLNFDVNINDYPDIDYFKLPKYVREKIFDPNSSNLINIKPTVDPKTGRYTYKFKYGYYGTNVENIVDITKIPFIDDNTRNDYYISNSIPINDYTFTDSDNINPDILIKKMFTTEGVNIKYPMEYINNKINY